MKRGMKRALVLGGAGFIGLALTRRLIDEGSAVRSVDIKKQSREFCRDPRVRDLRQEIPAWLACAGPYPFDEVYQLAADVGGAGHIFTGKHDADVMANNVRINTNVAQAFTYGRGRLLFTSSSCVYDDLFSTSMRALAETDVSQPSSAYGWEKLFSEKLYQAHARNYGLNVCISRFSTVYGPGSPFEGGRENAVAAICRKVIDAPDGGEVEVWGDGEQVRPLVYIDDIVEALIRLMRCKDFIGPVNLANTELTSCNEIAQMAIALSGKQLRIKNVPGPTGKQVLKMTTDLAEKHFGWHATTPFEVGLERTFKWISDQKRAIASAAA